MLSLSFRFFFNQVVKQTRQLTSSFFFSRKVLLCWCNVMHCSIFLLISSYLNTHSAHCKHGLPHKASSALQHICFQNSLRTYCDLKKSFRDLCLCEPYEEANNNHMARRKLSGLLPLLVGCSNNNYVTEIVCECLCVWEEEREREMLIYDKKSEVISTRNILIR